MKNRRNGFPHNLVKAVLRVLSWVYAAGVKVVDAAYRLGLRRTYSAGIPVVSVGNITLGGTGKTPLSAFIAEYFSSKGKKTAILSRGYGNDESVMLKLKFENIPVYVGQDRVASAEKARQDGRDVVILDDGFQHRRIKRDLNIALVDAGFFPDEDYFFPKGFLREAPSGLGRADIIVITKADRVDRNTLTGLSVRIKKIAGAAKPVVISRYNPVSFTDAFGKRRSLAEIHGKKVCLVSGIADPDYFAFTIAKTGAIIASRLDYSDHHRFTRRDMDAIALEHKKCAAGNIVVTEKDYVKIKEFDISAIKDKLLVLNIEMEIIEGKEDLFVRLDSVVCGQGV